MIATKCSIRFGCLEPATAEAVTALEVVQFCSSLGHDWVQFVGDAKTVVDTMNSNEPNWSNKGHIIDAIQTNTRHFKHRQISHVTREANQIAHVLERTASK